MIVAWVAITVALVAAFLWLAYEFITAPVREDLDDVQRARDDVAVRRAARAKARAGAPERGATVLLFPRSNNVVNLGAERPPVDRDGAA